MTSQHATTSGTSAAEVITHAALYQLDRAARFFAGDAPRPSQTLTIGGHTFTVEYREVNRKCYDFLPTPTASYKLDAKRVSRAVWYGMSNA